VPGLAGLTGEVAPTPQTAAVTQASPTPEPVVADVSPTSTVVERTASEVAQDWVDRWNIGDYAGMYALTSGTVRRAISRDDFIARYQGIVERAQLSPVQAAVTGVPDDERGVPIDIAFTSGIVGSFSEQNVVPMVHESDGWHVAWTPSAILNELGTDGCVDIDYLPAGRGSILDRHGEPLAYDGVVERVGIVPAQIPAEDEERVLDELSGLTGMSASAIK
jgi:hypothetical protein